MSGGNKIFILCEYEYVMLSPSVMNKKKYTSKESER